MTPTRARVRSLTIAALLGAFACSALAAQAGATKAPAVRSKPKCKHSPTGRTACKHKPKKPSNIVSGQYAGKDGFGEIGVQVGTATDGPHAGQRYVDIEGGSPKSVTCSNGLQGAVIQAATGYVPGRGRAFSGSETTPLFAYTISGTFTSSTAMKGTYESSQTLFGVTCSTGKQSFTAKWAP